MQIKRLAIGVAALAVMLSGCQGDYDLFAPVESPEIENAFEVHELWSDSCQGTGGFYSNLNPEVQDTVVYTAGRDGKVLSIRIPDHEELWTTDLDDEEENDGRRSARLSGGVAVKGARMAVGSENGWLYALNSATGELAWKKYMGSEIVTAPTFSDSGDRLFVLDGQGHVTCFDALNGEQLWISGDASNDLRLRKQSRPVVLGDSYLILGQASGKIAVLNQQDGSLIREFTVGKSRGTNVIERVSDVASTPLILEDLMYATSYDGNFVVYSLPQETELASLAYQSSKELAFDQNYLVITGDNGHVYCVSRSDYQEIWENSQLTYRNVTAPAIYGNYVVVGDLEGFVYFMSLSDGRIVAKFETDDSPIYARPLTVGNVIIIQTSGGEFLCWHYDPANNAAYKTLYAQTALSSQGQDLRLADEGTGKGVYGTGVTRAQLEARRVQAYKIANEIESHERMVQEQSREYERQRAEYERQRAEYEKARQQYEKERRAAISGFGLMPGVKSGDEENVFGEAPAEEPVAEAPATAEPLNEEQQEKASGFGLAQ